MNKSMVQKSAITVTLTAMLAAILVLGKLSLAVVPNVEIVTLCIIVFASVFPFRMTLAATIVFCLLDPLIYGFRLDVLLQYLLHYPTMCVAAAILEKLTGERKWLNYACIMALQAIFAVAFWLESPLLYMIMFHYPFKIYAMLGVPFFIANIVGNTVAIGLLYIPLRLFFKKNTKKLFKKNKPNIPTLVIPSDKCYNLKKSKGDSMIDFDTLLKLMNLKAKDIDNDLREEIVSAEREFWSVAEFTTYNREFDIDVLLDEGELYYKLKEHGAEKILVGVCTLGEKLDELILEASASYDFSKMMVFDTLANYAVSALHCEQMEEVRQVAEKVGYHLTDEYAPGTTVPLTVQNIIFNLLNQSDSKPSEIFAFPLIQKMKFSCKLPPTSQATINDADLQSEKASSISDHSISDIENEISTGSLDLIVRLTSELLMYPKKSLSYIFGLTKKETRGKVGHDCAACHAKNCSNRKNKNDMARVTVRYKGHIDYVDVRKGTNLLTVLRDFGYGITSPCGGRGACGKCKIKVLEGGGALLSSEIAYFTEKEKADGYRLACLMTVDAPITIAIDKSVGDIFISGDIAVMNKFSATNEIFAVLDVGTTTVALALIDKTAGEVVHIVNANNPQAIFGSDVISRIEYARQGGADRLHMEIIKCVNGLLGKLHEKYGEFTVDKLTISANTTMLHFILNRDATAMAMHPYTPSFLEKIIITGESLGIIGVKTVETFEGLSAFVGADIMSGVYYLGKPDNDKWKLLVDLGTNAEIALFSKDKMYCTAAASGPAFEGANISSGMSATVGAICEVVIENGKPICKTVGGEKSLGVCGTGLVDGVCVMKKLGAVDEDGGMEEKEFYLDDNISLTQKDIREFQVAKSAVRSGIELLMNKYRVTPDDISCICISGGFSKNINIDNAVFCGLLPKSLRDKTIAIGNTSLSGAIKATLEGDSYAKIVELGEYFDMACDASFIDLFMEHMSI